MRACSNAAGRRRTLGALGIASVLLLGGCAAARKQACESGDWEGLGYRDGRAGLGFERVGTLADRCSDYGIGVDSVAWTSGHTRGIGEYCAPVRGFDLGERGQEYGGNCPAALERRFLESYLRGLQVRRDELQLDFDRLQRDLDGARRSRLALDPEADASDVDAAAERAERLEGELEVNLAARRDTNARIGRWSRRL